MIGSYSCVVVATDWPHFRSLATYRQCPVCLLMLTDMPTLHCMHMQLIQRRCPLCAGSGLVPSSRGGTKYLRKCPQCGKLLGFVYEGGGFLRTAGDRLMLCKLVTSLLRP